MAMNKLHPGVKWSWRLGYIFVAIFFSVFFSIWFGGFMTVITKPDSIGGFVLGFFLTWLVLLIVFIILIEVWVRMAYNRWLYEFTDSNLKLERGVIWKRYSNIPYERVQNVDIHRGIIARILGFSSVMIQTAGYSGYYGGRHEGGVMSEGHIPAVSVEGAEKIREFVMKKISKHNKSGL